MDWRQAVEQCQGGVEEVVQPREGHVGLEFHASGGQHPHRAGPADGVLEQGGLADSRFAANEQARALAKARRGQSLVDRLQLPLSSQQHRLSVLLRRPARPTTRWGP